MKITILAVGKLKDKFISEGIEEFAKRLTPHCTLEIKEVKDEPAPERLSDKEALRVKTKEGEKLLMHIKEGDYTIALDLRGKKLTSEAFAERLDSVMMNHSHINFVIGGSLGLSDAVLSASNFRLSFSDFTFPHGLMRLILAEQIYRAFRIINGFPYHK
ncbi:23S rRNA (pseudouridine(1915)-N(3))-methyltransferase RlmH [Peptoniphilus equinus]|uniref:Ribosomal RNA large subunit methyltransferase H n=1 Tax=Peptoniphilus equinus TaxID=3016343 RepID=A0ABY7QTA9_9FIRM|nr:23S rRNA (pseudouridine(1915)-N(3))-methyltransferase RlmH [Peptoniphilus equinus]WBW50028.1 23S rRNA (pseudouridine(1915)-N(3))-methyltransferase RlmH [Peptoniphilus equinus]